MIYIFDLFIMNYETNIPRPIGYDFIQLPDYPTSEELYNALMGKYEFLRNASHCKKVYLFSKNQSEICLGIDFTRYNRNGENSSYRLVANNVREAPRVREPEKYLNYNIDIDV